MNEVAINAPNLWRLDTPGHSGWARTARAGDPNKYFMVSTDSHANEPPDLWDKRIDAKYRERVPRIITDEQGVQWRYCEGYRPDRVRVMSFEGEDWVRSKPAPMCRTASATTAPTGSTSRSSSPTRASRCGRRPTRCSPTRSAGCGTTGRGSSLARIPTPCCRWPRSRPAISKARWPRSSGSPKSASARCRCRASRCGAGMTSSTSTTICRISTRCGG